jgi:acyl-CoA thioesterase-2
MPIALAEALACFALTQTADDEYAAPNMAYYGPGRDVVFGGQLIGQAIAAATRSSGGKVVETINTHFPRTGRVTQDLAIKVRPLNAGKSFDTVGVSIRQGDRLIAESLVLLHEPDPDAVRHGRIEDFRDRPEAADPRATSIEGYSTFVADNVDYLAPDDLGPARMKVWAKFDGPTDPTTSQALVAIAATPFMIGVALRPHAGLNIAQAHKSLSTGVLSQTLTFHEPIVASDWHLFVHEAPYAGHGRTFGRGEVFTAAGDLVASFSQDGLLRGLDATAVSSGGATRL